MGRGKSSYFSVKKYFWFIILTWSVKIFAGPSKKEKFFQNVFLVEEERLLKNLFHLAMDAGFEKFYQIYTQNLDLAQRHLAQKSLPTSQDWNEIEELDTAIYHEMSAELTKELIGN